MISSQLTTQAQASQLMADARELLNTGNAIAAVKEMGLACELLRSDASFRGLLCVALQRLGIVLHRSNHYFPAIHASHEAQKIADTLPDLSDFDRVRARANYAAALQAGGFFSEAQACLTEILKSPESNDPRILSTIRGNLAYCALLKSDFEGAIAYAGKGWEAIPDQDYPELNRGETSLWLDIISCEAMIRLGQKAQALERMLTRRRFEQPLAVVSQIREMQMLGLCEVVNGHVDVGLTRLEQGLQLARKTGLSIDTALRAMISARDALGHHAESLVLIDELSQLMHAGAKATASFARETTDISASVVPDHNDFEDAIQSHAADTRLLRMLQLARSHPLPALHQLARAASLIDDETGNHCARVGKLAFAFSRAMGIDAITAQQYADAAELHDIGKVGISHQILLKPGRLSAAEMAIVRRHPEIGAGILSQDEHPVAALAATAALHHHERWDGTGYPRGLIGAEIPRIARLVSICDVYDVIRSARPYKRPQSFDEAIAELTFHSGKQFDPHIMKLFLALPHEVLNFGY